MTDSYEHITWYKIICYFETIDLWLVQWNKSLSEASLQQSILTCSPIHCILMIQSIHLLMLTTQKYSVIIQRRIQKYRKCDKNTTVRWHCFICVPQTEAVEAHSSPEYHSSSKHVEKKDKYIILFFGRRFYIVGSHYMPPLTCNKKMVSLICKAANHPISGEHHLQMGSQVMESLFSPGAVFHVG